MDSITEFSIGLALIAGEGRTDEEAQELLQKNNNNISFISSLAERNDNNTHLSRRKEQIH